MSVNNVRQCNGNFLLMHPATRDYFYSRRVMFARTSVVFAFFLIVFQCFGAAPVATISSTQPLVISGVTVPANRVISWPVSIHDEIATQAAPAMLRFTDGTIVTLQRNSRLKLEQGKAGVELKMMAGSAIYDLKPHSTVTIDSGATLAAAATTTSVAPPPVKSASGSANEAAATALAYRMPSTAPSTGVVFAPSLISTNSFLPQPGRQATTSVGSGLKVVLPNGTIFEVHLVSEGNQSTYVIDKIATPIGNGQYLAIDAPNLIGARLVVVSGGTGQSQASIFLPGSSTPLDPAAVADLISQGATASYNDSVSKGQIPPGTPAPAPPGPVTTMKVSGQS